jgi:hypothetical protein
MISVLRSPVIPLPISGHVELGRSGTLRVWRRVGSRRRSLAVYRLFVNESAPAVGDYLVVGFVSLSLR